MKDETQFEQLILLYNQLKNGAVDIKNLIEKEEFDEAITMIQLREPIYLNCKCIRRYLELTKEQESELENILSDIRVLELENIKLLELRKEQVKRELKKTQQNEKIHQAYDFDENQNGHIVNFEE